MIAKTYIMQELAKLEKLFNRALSDKKIGNPEMYAKYAILETCGWIEESMDNIALMCVNRNGINKKKKLFEKEILGRMYDFKYTSFERILTSVIGITSLERLESDIGEKTVSKLQGHLGSLTTARNNHAHMTLKGAYGAGVIPDNPSKTKSTFLEVYSCLKEYESKLRKPYRK